MKNFAANFVIVVFILGSFASGYVLANMSQRGENIVFTNTTDRAVIFGYEVLGSNDETECFQVTVNPNDIFTYVFATQPPRNVSFFVIDGEASTRVYEYIFSMSILDLFMRTDRIVTYKNGKLAVTT